MNKNMDLIRTKHSSISLSEQVQKYLKRIQENFHKEINYFCHARIYQNRKRICLTSLPNFHKSYINEKLYLSDNLDTPISNYTSGVFDWQNDTYSDTHLICRDEFKIEQGITIIIRSTLFCDFFTFGGLVNNYDPLIYTNKNIFYRIIQDYYNQCYKLIINSDDLILFRNEYKNTNIDIKIPSNVNIKNPENKKKYYMSKIYLSDISDTAYITQAEKKILNLIVTGQTHVEISVTLNKRLSTIRNQVDNIKKRVGCKTQEEMVFKIAKSIFSDMVFE